MRAHTVETKRKGCRWWLWGWIGMIVVAVFAVVSPDEPKAKGIAVGDVCEVGPDGGAWFATTDAAWDQMIDAQNAKSGALLGRLITRGQAFREPAGSRVLIVRKSMFAAWCQVTSGANEGAEGWTQIDRLSPLR